MRGTLTWTETRALAKGAWREQLNQGWRFSRAKAGLWPFAAQIGFAALLLWRLEPAPSAEHLALTATTAAMLGAGSAFVTGLLRGREDLYGKSVLRNLHISPAPGVSMLAGLLLAGVPARMSSSLLVAALVGYLLPAGGFWWTLPLLWLLTLISSLAGYLAALLALMIWVRITPRSLAVMWGIAVMIGFSAGITVVGLISVGGPVVAIAAFLRARASWLIGGLGGLVGLPGLRMAAWAALFPEKAGEWYREAYLNMQELGDGRLRLRSSRWPRLLPGAAGALQARLWREMWLNGFTWVRLGFMLLCFGLLIWRPAPLNALAEIFPTAVIMGFGLTAALGSFGELPGTIGGSDGPNIGLSMVAGVRAGEVATAKWVASLPLAVLSTVSTGVTAIMLHRPGLSLSLAAGLIGFGFGVIATAGGLCDLDPQTEATERDVPDILRSVLEQVPRKPGGVLGYFGGLLYAVAAVWLCQRVSGALLPLAAGSAAVAHLAWMIGIRHLKALGM